MSSSAAKRRSVVALGSIQHLQHFYAKQKAAEPSASPHPLARPLPALGRRANGTAPAALQISEEEEEEGDDGLPPTPVPPERIEVKPYEDVEREEVPTIDEAWREVDDVCRRWGLVEHVKATNRAPSMSAQLSGDSHLSLALTPSRSHSPTPPIEPSEPDHALVLNLMTATTSAIRLVQRYVLALPPVYNGPDHVNDITNALAGYAINESPLTVRHQSQLGVSTAARPRTSANVVARNPLPTPSKSLQDDPLAALRKASLDVLTVLKELDVRFGLPTDRSKSPALLSDSALSDESREPSRTTSPIDGLEGGGHLYREDVSLDDLRREASVVQEWIETADRVLSASSALDIRVPRSPTRSISASSSSSFDPSLPAWAHTARYTDQPLAQSHALLSAFLPGTLRTRLGSAADRSALLDSLADGQLLCLAYNAALRSSPRPWGFVPPSAIHDLHAREANVTVGRTFRRFENLRVLAAALKLRYALSLGGDTREARAKSAPPQVSGAVFDARAVARRDEGWEAMLEVLVRAWTEAVVRETVDDALG